YSFYNGSPLGGSPVGPLALGSDGNLYGTAELGGATGSGTVFRVIPPGTMSLVTSFDGTNGAGPIGLRNGVDGYLYGTAAFGGAQSEGTVFRVSTNGELKAIHSFTTNYWRFYGGPMLDVVQATDGYLYGSTHGGSGPGGFNWVIFRLSTNGTFTMLVKSN